MMDETVKRFLRKCLILNPAVAFVLIGISIVLVAGAHYWSNQEIMREIAQQGGSVGMIPDSWFEHQLSNSIGEYYEWICGSDHQFKDVYLQELVLDESLLQRFSELKKLWSLYLDYSNITDSGCKYIGALPYLDELTLTKTLVTNAGIEHLRGLNISYLVLDETAITDHGLSHLSGMTSLDWLQLCDTKITDDGLMHLTGIPNLITLFLQNTQVSVEGLQYIRKMKSLEFVDLQGTCVTKSEIQKLMTEMPQLRIAVDWLPIP
jgi:hypothetical protein